MEFEAELSPRHSEERGLANRRKSPAWDFNWGPARWVHIKTRIKSRPEYIGFVDEDEGPHVYLLRPHIMDREGKWIDSWTWREEKGPLPELRDGTTFFGEVILYKWDITEIKEIDFPGEIDRCWYCGKKINKGRFCAPNHEFVFRMMNLDSEMLDDIDSKRWTSKDSPLELERLFDLGTITSDLEKTGTKTERRFTKKIGIISKLVEHETRLSGIYLQECLTKERIGIHYKQNYVLNNTIGNQPYRSISALLLIRNSLYGSARPILRQFFESLILAKYADYEANLSRRWHAQNELTPPHKLVSPSRDVLSILADQGRPVQKLRETWRDLCAMTHATRLSQQVLRVPAPDDPKEFNESLKISNYFANTEYTLDLLFLILAMNFHLIRAHLAEGAKSWWFGNARDPYGSYKREKRLQKEIHMLIGKYLEESEKKQPLATRMLKDNIREYETPWW